MTALQERELKQQGAIEAAEENLVSPEQAEKQMVEEAKNAGIPAFTFDPDATPEQKRAQARAVSYPLLRPSTAIRWFAECRMLNRRDQRNVGMFFWS